MEESLSGTWAGMAQGDLAPEMMSSTKLSTVSRGSKEDMPQMMTLASPGLCPPPSCKGRAKLTHEFGVETNPLLFPAICGPPVRLTVMARREGLLSYGIRNTLQHPLANRELEIVLQHLHPTLPAVRPTHQSPPWSGPSCRSLSPGGGGSRRSAPRWGAPNAPTPALPACCWVHAQWRAAGWRTMLAGEHLERARPTTPQTFPTKPP